MDSYFYINLTADTTNRYDQENFIPFNVDNYDPIQSNILGALTSIPSGGQYTIQGAESRPDIISNDIYGDPQYWWIILAYNELTTIDSLTNGLEIEYPRVDLLEDYYFTLKTQQDAVDEVTT
jgi:hypothetical protein